MSNRWSSLLAALLIFCCLCAVPQTVKKTKDPKQKAALGAKLQKHKQRLQTLKKKVTQKRYEATRRKLDVQEVDNRLDRIEASLVKTRAHLAESQRRLYTVTLERSKASLALAIKQEQFSRRLANIYKQGDSRFLTALIGTESVGDLASRSYILRRIANKDREISDEYQQAKRNLDSKTDQQKRLVERVKAAMDRQEVEEGQLEVALEDKKEAYHQALQSLSAAEDEYAEENAATKQIEAELARYYTTPSSGSVKTWTGGYARPVPGPITSGFGYRNHPILHVRKLHTGLDIGAAHGTAIRAAAGGRVIKAAYYRGYGNCVIVDHGGGMATLYGHCSALLVRVGQDVKQGEVIARVGATGLATGPHLHYELRRNGVPINPR